jgi:hypothetical protein
MFGLEVEMVCKVHVLRWGFVEKNLNAIWKKIRRVSLQGCLLVRIYVFLRKSKRGSSALETVIFRLSNLSHEKLFAADYWWPRSMTSRVCASLAITNYFYKKSICNPVVLL